MNTLFALPEENKAHPARYTDALLSTFVRMLRGSRRILDPFGGTGKVFLLEHWLPGIQIEAVEIEPEWAAINPRTTLGNALALPWPDGYFDAICTSPTYGNRMADTFARISGSIEPRGKYAWDLRRELSPDNTGRLQWGAEYRRMHELAWAEALRVLQPGGRFVLNVKDHIRDGERQHVTDWHIETLKALGLVVREHERINCAGMRIYRNGGKRVDYESVVLLERHLTSVPADRLSVAAADDQEMTSAAAEHRR